MDIAQRCGALRGSMSRVIARIDPDTLVSPIEGLRLSGHTLGEQLAAPSRHRTLLCFLRHFGCIFCREMVRDIKWASDSNPSYPSVLFVGQGTPEETRHFIDPMWPDVPIICDPDRHLYKAVGLGQGSIYQMFGPSVWACGIRAAAKGNFVGRFVGDPWTMPGAFLVDRTGHVLWYHEFRHQGSHPDWARIPQLAAAIEDPVAALATLV